MPPRPPSATVAGRHIRRSFGRRLAVPQADARERDRNGEVDVLASARHQDADDVTLLVERGPSRIAGIRGRVSLDRPRGDATDDSRGDGAVETVRAAHE